MSMKTRTDSFTQITPRAVRVDIADLAVSRVPMSDKEWRSRENRLYIRMLVARKLPKLAAALAFADGIPCPVCGGIMMHVPVGAT